VRVYVGVHLYRERERPVDAAYVCVYVLLMCC